MKEFVKYFLFETASSKEMPQKADAKAPHRTYKAPPSKREPACDGETAEAFMPSPEGEGDLLPPLLRREQIG